MAAGMGLPGSQTGLRWEQPDVERVVTACREQAAALEAQAASMRSAHASADAELSAALDAVGWLPEWGSLRCRRGEGEGGFKSSL